MAQAVLYTPHPNQKKIHDSIIHENYKYYLINIGRQFGKTLLATNQMIYWALNERGVKIGWVSPIYRQAKKVFKETFKAFERRPEMYAKGTSHSDLIIQYPTGSSIQFFSSENYDSIRGFTFDYLICDEFAFMDERAWSEVLRATVLAKGKKVLLISTPKGRNHFYTLHCLDGVNDQYKSFHMTSYDNPLINPTEIDDAKLTLPERIFRQEYLAEFLEDGSGVFVKFDEIATAERTTNLYAGIDVGRADDYTVLTIINSSGNIFYCERWRHLPWDVITTSIANKINELGCKSQIEVNGIGDVVFENIKAKLKQPSLLQPFITTAKTKNDIIEGLQVAGQNKEFKIQPIDWLLKEFSMFTYEYSHKTRAVKYGAPVGHHDDGVMSCAIAYNSLKTMKKQGTYNIV